MSTQKSNRFHSFGLALKEALDLAGVTPASLSRVTGKDKGQISKYINGKILPKRLTQLELTNPIGYEIFKIDGEWEIKKRLEIEDSVSEGRVDYSVEDLGKEKKYVGDIFSELQTLNKLFDEMLINEKLSEADKKIQIEMIKEKLAVLLKSILDTTN